MNIPDIDPIAGNLQQQIEQAAQRSYDWLLTLISEGQDPRKATETVLRSFQGEYITAMTEAFSAAMIANVTPGSVLAMQVGDVLLSERLYAHTRQTGQEVAAIVRKHAQGLQQARSLALSLYDGYNPRDGIKRPLEGVARAELPKALRELTQNPGPRQDLTSLLTQMQQQASRLKSEALKAGYMEALKAWEQGKGADVLKQRLWVAEREKTRYMANRIAQTELARAHQGKVAEQIMRDDTITVVQVKLNPRHPLPDICDLHARADLWGLGPGLYPKAKAPKPPFHPFCWCRLVTRPDKTADLAREREDAVREWLRTLPPADAARVLGNRQRLEYVLNGADWEKVTQAAVREEYRLRRVGDGVDRTAPITKSTLPTPVFQAQNTAKAAAEWAVNNNLADFADYSGVKPAVANAFNQSLFEHLQDFPGLRAFQKFVGTGQAQFSRWRELEIERDIAKLKAANPQVQNYDWRSLSEKRVKPKKVGNQYAHAWNHPDVSGIAVNKKWGASPDVFEKAVARDVINGHLQATGATLKSVADHEMGHMVDYALGLRSDSEVLQLYSQAQAAGIRKEVSGYAGTNIAEFIAECWAESRNSPAPRKFAQKIADIARRRYSAKYP